MVRGRRVRRRVRGQLQVRAGFYSTLFLFETFMFNQLTYFRSGRALDTCFVSGSNNYVKGFYFFIFIGNVLKL